MRASARWIAVPVAAVLVGVPLISFGASEPAPPCTAQSSHAHWEDYEIGWHRGEPILPLPERLDLDGDLVALGRDLFHDPLLSGDRSVSCASCHDVAEGGDDGRRFSVGIHDQVGKINSPTILNSAFNFRQLWTGAADSLEAQAGGPVRNPKVMGGDWSTISQRITDDPEYLARFAALFDGEVSERTVSSALATYQRSLVTSGGRFDRWLRGADEALTSDELRGYQLFKSIGCVSCHQGINVGGNMFQKMGHMADYFEEIGSDEACNLGRFKVTGDERDLHLFKVPTLRNVSRTAPYFHDGSARSLEGAVKIMARYQLGIRLEQEEVDLIVAFLRTLDGPLPEGDR